MGGDRRHVGRADVVDRVQGVCAFACVERRIHPLLRSLGGTSCVCVGSSWYAGVIQIKILDTRLLLHVDAETGVQPIAGESLVRQAHGRTLRVLHAIMQTTRLISALANRRHAFCDDGHSKRRALAGDGREISKKI